MSIEGVCSYLVNVGNDYLLGLGEISALMTLTIGYEAIFGARKPEQLMKISF